MSEQLHSTGSYTDHMLLLDVHYLQGIELMLFSPFLYFDKCYKIGQLQKVKSFQTKGIFFKLKANHQSMSDSRYCAYSWRKLLMKLVDDNNVDALSLIIIICKYVYVVIA